MKNNIEKMKTFEIVEYLKLKRFLHGLFYIDKKYFEKKYNIQINDCDWLNFIEYVEYNFHECNNFINDEIQDFVVEEWISGKN